MPQFLASYCISDVCEENFLDSIFVFQKMTAANSSKLDTCQKLWQGAGAEVISRSFRKLFKGLRRAGITRAARITSGEKERPR